jgi:hypothetical protein
MTRTRETLGTVREKFGRELPRHISIVEVSFDTKTGNSKVRIDCKEHGIQEPVFLGYLRKSKYYCVQCGNMAKGQTSGKSRYSDTAKRNMRLKRLKRWKENSHKRYDGLYDYYAVDKTFSTAKFPKVHVRCKRHNEWFWVLPDKHYQNRSGGCPNCEREMRFRSRTLKRKHIFEAWFAENHGHRLTINSPFRGMMSPLVVYCSIHKNSTKIVPSAFMQNSNWGCGDCASEAISRARRVTEQEVLSRYSDKLPPGISFESVRFDEAIGQTMTVLKCAVHGKQEPVPLYYLRTTPTFCKECGFVLRGFPEQLVKKFQMDGTTGRRSRLGVMELKVHGMKGLKVGITNRTLEERYAGYLERVFYCAHLSELDALVLENRIKLKFYRNRDDRFIKAGMRSGKRWGGDTEFYLYRFKEKIVKLVKDFEIELEEGLVDYQFEQARILVPKTIF